MRINTDNGDIVLPVNASMSITKQNPLTHKDVEEFSLNQSIPRLKNLKIFGDWYPQSAVTGLVRKQDARLFENGSQMVSGTVHLTKYDEDNYEIMLKGRRSDVIAQTDGKSLKDLNWNTESVVGSSDVLIRLTEMTDRLDGAAKWYAFPVYNPGYTTKTYPSAIINKWDFDNQEFKYDPLYINTVFLRVYAVLEDLFAIYGYQTDYNYLKENTEWSRLCIFNNYDLLHHPDSFTFGNLLPDMDVRDFISAIEYATGTVIFINSHQRSIRIEKVESLFSTTPKDTAPYLLRGKSIELEQKDGYDIKFSAETNDDFLKNTGMYADEVDVTGTVTSYDDLPTPDSTNEGKIYAVTAMGMSYICESNDNSQYVWNPYTGMVGGIKSGNGDTAFEIKAYPVLNGQQEDSATIVVYNDPQNYAPQTVAVRYMIPEVSIPKGDAEGLRLLFYRELSDAVCDITLQPGQYVDDRNVRYPHASFTFYDTAGNQYANNVHELTPTYILSVQLTFIMFMSIAQQTNVKLIGGIKLWDDFDFESRYLVDGNMAILDSMTTQTDGNSEKIYDCNFLVLPPT